jgi:hypothetical protein
MQPCDAASESNKASERFGKSQAAAHGQVRLLSLDRIPKHVQV